MSNERLRAAVLSSGLGIDGVADGLGVDRKTIERWIAGRVPLPAPPVRPRRSAVA